MKGTEMVRYKMTITFECDRPLTNEEEAAFITSCVVQIEEPIDSDCEDIDISTSNINAKLEIDENE